MKIYLLRHGQTDLNKDRKMACDIDVELNATGIQQAERAGELLSGVDYDIVLSSPLIRAKRTAEIANNKRASLVIDDRLRERSVGVLDGKHLADIDLTEFFDYYKNAEYEGAENIQDFCKRIWGFLDEVKEKYKDSTALIVTHGIVIRAIKAYILGLPADGNIRAYGVENGAVEEYTLQA